MRAGVACATRARTAAVSCRSTCAYPWLASLHMTAPSASEAQPGCLHRYDTPQLLGTSNMPVLRNDAIKSALAL